MTPRVSGDDSVIDVYCLSLILQIVVPSVHLI